MCGYVEMRCNRILDVPIILWGVQRRSNGAQNCVGMGIECLRNAGKELQVFVDATASLMWF